MDHNDAEMARMARQDHIGPAVPQNEECLAPTDPDQLSRESTLLREERHRERARIARELHDSLLQGFVGASMHLFAALNQIPEDSPGTTSLRLASCLVERALQEARNIMHELRGHEGHGFRSTPENLEQALSLVHEEFRLCSGAHFQISVKGQHRVLNPSIQEQIYLISREALVNALRHSQATSIEVEVEHLPDGVRLVIRDDGCGIDPEMLRSGPITHWGLTGMHERAADIGAHLRIQTGPESGTEVEICAPGLLRNPT